MPLDLGRELCLNHGYTHLYSLDGYRVLKDPDGMQFLYDESRRKLYSSSEVISDSISIDRFFTPTESLETQDFLLNQRWNFQPSFSRDKEKKTLYQKTLLSLVAIAAVSMLSWTFSDLREREQIESLENKRIENTTSFNSYDFKEE